MRERRLRVGINGFGRIGRAVTRIGLASQAFDLVAINDVNPDIQNLRYLLQYDSVYGRLAAPVAVEGAELVLDGQRATVYSEREVARVPWEEHDTDVVIDSSGVAANLLALPQLKDRGVRHCIVTNSPDPSHLDRSVIVGINEGSLTPQDFVISGSICDANALVAVMYPIEQAYGIEHGSLTTLHPWLAYQNLLDGPSFSDEYPLGRASTLSLIPKTTSCVRAAAQVMPGLDQKFISVSYRVPTPVVAAADISVRLARPTTRQAVIDLLRERERKQRYPVLKNSEEPLVSVDFTGSEYSAIVDHRWTELQAGVQLKLVVWYDNEWGYASRIVDLVGHLASLGG